MDDEIKRAALDADCWDVACPVCGQPPYVACNNDPDDQGHRRRWAAAGAQTLRAQGS